MKKKILVTIGVLVPMLLLGATIIGYEDWQLRGSAPGNPASNFLRAWADTTAGAFKCLTSSGAACYWSVDYAGTYNAGNLPVSHLNSGTGANASTFWRGDGTWAGPTAASIVPTQSAQTWSAAGGGVGQVVQSASNVCAGTSCSATLGGVTAGHLLVVIVSSFGITAPTDSGDTFVLSSSSNQGINQALYYTCSANGGSTTVSMTGGSRAVHIHVLEISGNATLSCLDQQAANGGGGVSVTSLSVTSPSVTSGTEIVITAFNSNFSSCTGITADAGTTLLQSTLSTGTASGNWPVVTNVYDANTGLSGAITMSATCNATSAFWNATMATFKIATPAGSVTNFDLSLANTFKITLAGNITSSTWSNQAAGLQATVAVCQNATGGYTFAWPTNTTGAMTIGSTASKCNVQTFVSDGTNMIATSPGVTNQ